MPDPTVASATPAPRTPRAADLATALRECEAARASLDVPAELLQNLCSTLVRQAPRDLALVVFACADAAGPVAVAASAGDVAALAGLNLGTHEQPLTDLIGAALLQRRPVLCRRRRSDPAHARWGARAWRLGFLMACAVPFPAGPGRSGVIAVYSPEEDAFSADELDMLVDIAAALARPVARGANN